MRSMRTALLAGLLGAMAWSGDAVGDDLPPPQIKPKRRIDGTARPAPLPAQPPRAPLAPAAPMPAAPMPSTPRPVVNVPDASGGGSGWSTPRPGAPAAPVAPRPPQPAAPAPSGRDIQREVDGYFAGDTARIGTGGTGGGAGYDRGFYIDAGKFRLNINATLQTRYEAFLWDGPSPTPGGDRSGFSVPRALLKFSGTAPCNIRYFAMLEFGHHGGPTALFQNQGCAFCGGNLGANNQSNNFDVLREAWIEWGCSKAINVRMGQIALPTTRQLMTAPERQQFVDIALGSSWLGLGMPGYTDRNRDFGLAFHGAFGPRDSLSYLVTITNGDGADSIRNVIDTRTSDNLAYAARLNWAFLNPIGLQEGALRQRTCEWYGEVGAWAFYYADRSHRPFMVQGDFLRAGADVALGYGPWSFTGAFTFVEDMDQMGNLDDSSTAWLAQLGYHFVGTPIEVAFRFSGYDNEGPVLGNGWAREWAGGVNYYLNGHGNKLQVDAAYIDTSTNGFLVLDSYPGYSNFLTNGNTAWLIRFQWQLAL